MRPLLLILSVVWGLPKLAVGAQCGVATADFSRLNSRVVGGESVGYFRFPWFVALSRRGKQGVDVTCAGSLITDRHVLTAAHCFRRTDRPELLYRVVLGMVDRCEAKEHRRIEMLTSRVFIHENYTPRSTAHDIAVIELSAPTHFMPICLPPQSINNAGKRASVIGFGSTQVRRARYPCVLQEANVTIITRRACRTSRLQPKNSNVAGTLCAGVYDGGIDACDGDSGGPLQTQYGGLFTVQGIVSFGEGCARRKVPGVYTDVSYYRSWIDRQISKTQHYTAPDPIFWNKESDLETVEPDDLQVWGDPETAIDDSRDLIPIVDPQS